MKIKIDIEKREVVLIGRYTVKDLVRLLHEFPDIAGYSIVSVENDLAHIQNMMYIGNRTLTY